MEISLYICSLYFSLSFKSIFVNANAHGCLQYPAGIVGHLYCWCYMQRCKTEILCKAKALPFAVWDILFWCIALKWESWNPLRFHCFWQEICKCLKVAAPQEELRDRIAKLLREIENLLILLFADHFFFFYGFFWESWQIQEDSLCF